MISLDTDAVHEAPHNRKKQKTHIHGDIDRIDHEEDAEESLVDMGLRSFLNEAEIPGVTRHVLEECVERLEAVLDRMQEMQVDEKMVGEEVMKQMRFQGMVRGDVEYLCIYFLSCVVVVWVGMCLCVSWLSLPVYICTYIYVFCYIYIYIYPFFH